MKPSTLSLVRYTLTIYALGLLTLLGCSNSNNPSAQAPTPITITAPSPETPQSSPETEKPEVKERFNFDDGTYAELSRQDRMLYYVPREINATLSLSTLGSNLGFLPGTGGLAKRCVALRNAIKESHDPDYTRVQYETAGYYAARASVKHGFAEKLKELRAWLDSRKLNGFEIEIVNGRLNVSNLITPSLMLKQIPQGRDLNSIAKILQLQLNRQSEQTLSIGQLCDIISEETVFLLSGPEIPVRFRLDKDYMR